MDGGSILSERVIGARRALEKAASDRRRAIRNSLKLQRHDDDGEARGNLAPTPEAGQHGAVPRVEKQVQDAAGDIGYPFQRIGLLDEWERSGKITPEMRQAGDKFHEQFHLACLDPIHAADMARVGGSPGPMKHRGSIDARDAIRDALAALGGPESQSGCGAWFVLGCEFSLRQWVEREHWRGRHMTQQNAAGTMISVLDTLKAHMGY